MIKYEVSEFTNDYQEIDEFETLDQAKQFASYFASFHNIDIENVSIWENVYDDDDEISLISSSFVCNAE